MLEQFLAEFPSIRFGRHQVSHQPQASRIEAEFDAEWFPSEIPAGTFRMGDATIDLITAPEDHEARIEAPFQMAKYPVTNELYALFDAGYAARFDDYERYSPAARCPAIYINWYDAWVAATWLHGRLPDEYEWERACRGNKGTTTRTRWFHGNEEEGLEKYAWYAKNSGHRTHEVDEKLSNGEPAKQPNDYGLYHMHGNVWEWTASWYHDDPRQGRAPDYIGSSRVLRGGSWFAGADSCRSADRRHDAPGSADLVTGFRLCRVCLPS
jgi:formylglycine-generating enzyme required for sulfatase activity